MSGGRFLLADAAPLFSQLDSSRFGSGQAFAGRPSAQIFPVAILLPRAEPRASIRCLRSFAALKARDQPSGVLPQSSGRPVHDLVESPRGFSSQRDPALLYRAPGKTTVVARSAAALAALQPATPRAFRGCKTLIPPISTLCKREYPRLQLPR